MAQIATVGNTALGNSLQQILMSDDIQPGAMPSYQLCKIIYLCHPMGAKMVETPVRLAMSQQREISIPNSPETLIQEAFIAEWKALKIDATIQQTAFISRTYGIGSVIFGAVNFPTDEPLALETLADLQIYFNALDPLNTSGSLVLNQNPNAPDFQKATAVTAGGQKYHFSRSCTLMNETPVYISYTPSAYGFVGRSVFQRALFPLKSFVTSMIADDEIMTKAAVIIAKIKNPGSITDKISGAINKIKRNFLKDAKNGNVINISNDDSVETLNLQNVDKAVSVVRNNIIENIASSAVMPPALLLSDGYAKVLANGSEDFKATVQYINGVREWLDPVYAFFDNIVMYRAWSPAFYKRVQDQFPEYQNVSYEQAFYEWKNSFVATWPSLLIEPESEKSKSDKVKLDSVISLLEKLLPSLDPTNAASLVEWVTLNISSMKTLFSDPLDFDADELLAYLQEKNEAAKQQGGEIETQPGNEA